MWTPEKAAAFLAESGFPLDAAYIVVHEAPDILTFPVVAAEYHQVGVTEEFAHSTQAMGEAFRKTENALLFLDLSLKVGVHKETNQLAAYGFFVWLVVKDQDMLALAHVLAVSYRQVVMESRQNEQ